MSIYSQSNYQQCVFGGFYQCLITMFTVCMQLGFVLPNKRERFPQRCPSATVPSGALRAKRAFYVATPTAWLTGIYAATSVPALALCAGCQMCTPLFGRRKRKTLRATPAICRRADRENRRAPRRVFGPTQGGEPYAKLNYVIFKGTFYWF